MNNKQTIILFTSIGLVAAVFAGWLYPKNRTMPSPPPPPPAELVVRDGCLQSGQVAREIENERIVVWNNDNDRQEISSFAIPKDTRPSDHSADYETELRNCGAYMVRIVASGNKELWRYSYNGQGEKLFTLMGQGSPGKPRSYSYWFKIDELERYVALASGEGSIVVIIKDLGKGEDLFEKQLEGTELETDSSRWIGDIFHVRANIRLRPLEVCEGDIDTRSWTIEWICSE